MSTHASGPWRRGYILTTEKTKRWHPKVRAAADREERLTIFANFRESDQGKSRIAIAKIYDNPDAEANANLISAAPEMLEALQKVSPYMEAAEKAGLVGNEGCHWPVELVREAIKKAEGGE